MKLALLLLAIIYFCFCPHQRPTLADCFAGMQRENREAGVRIEKMRRDLVRLDLVINNIDAKGATGG